MPRYTSCTGRDVILRFKGTAITIPTNGYYETSAEDLNTLFPRHIAKLLPDAVIREIDVTAPAPTPHVKETEFPPLHPIQIPLNITETEIPNFTAVIIPIDFPDVAESIAPIPVILSNIYAAETTNPAPITISIPTIPTTPMPNPTTILIPVRQIEQPKIKKIIVNSPIQMPLAPVKEIIIREEISEKITKIINNSMEASGDKDIKAFLSMIESILSEK